MNFHEQRARMVDEQLRARGITDTRVLEGFGKVEREVFVPHAFRHDAYADHPIPIGAGQTISQPYIVALMIMSLQLQGHERVLEIGTGSGYETAILAELSLEVYSVERIRDLLESAGRTLAGLQYDNVHLSAGNGSLGWHEEAPFDAIIVSAAAPDIPASLVPQLVDHGRMIVPVGSQESQVLLAVQREGMELRQHRLVHCQFVPLVGRDGWPA